MDLKRVFACLSGSGSLALAWFAYEEYIYFLGFPDGYISEVGAAERKLAIVFIAVSLPMGAYLLYLGCLAAERRTGGKLTTAIALYLFFVLGVVLADAYCQAHLVGGSGG